MPSSALDLCCQLSPLEHVEGITFIADPRWALPPSHGHEAMNTSYLFGGVRADARTKQSRTATRLCITRNQHELRFGK